MFDNRKQHVSPLFREIVRNDKRVDFWRRQRVPIFAAACRVLRRKRELIQAAEKALRWNTDKGKLG